MFAFNAYRVSAAYLGIISPPNSSTERAVARCEGCWFKQCESIMV